MSTAKSYFKDKKEEQCYNLLRITPRKIQRLHTNPWRVNSCQNALSLQIHGRFAQKSAETVRSPEISLPKNQPISPHCMRRTSQHKTSHHKEASQTICNANQLTGFHKRQGPAKRYFQTDRVPLGGLKRSSHR